MYKKLFWLIPLCIIIVLLFCFEKSFLRIFKNKEHLNYKHNEINSIKVILSNEEFA